jgi:hypothetical protein
MELKTHINVEVDLGKNHNICYDDYVDCKRIWDTEKRIINLV